MCATGIGPGSWATIASCTAGCDLPAASPIRPVGVLSKAAASEMRNTRQRRAAIVRGKLPRTPLKPRSAHRQMRRPWASAALATMSQPAPAVRSHCRQRAAIPHAGARQLEVNPACGGLVRDRSCSHSLAHQSIRPEGEREGAVFEPPAVAAGAVGSSQPGARRKKDVWATTGGLATGAPFGRSGERLRRDPHAGSCGLADPEASIDQADAAWRKAGCRCRPPSQTQARGPAAEAGCCQRSCTARIRLCAHACRLWSYVRIPKGGERRARGPMPAYRLQPTSRSHACSAPSVCGGASTISTARWSGSAPPTRAGRPPQIRASSVAVSMRATVERTLGTPSSGPPPQGHRRSKLHPSRSHYCLPFSTPRTRSRAGLIPPPRTATNRSRAHAGRSEV